MERVWQAMDRAEAPPPRPGARFAPYLYGAALVALGLAGRIGLSRVFGDRVVSILFIPAILVASATGGLMPGLATTALALAAAFALLTRFGMGLANEIDAASLGVLGVAIAFGGRWLHATRSSLEESNRHLQRTAGSPPVDPRHRPRRDDRHRRTGPGSIVRPRRRAAVSMDHEPRSSGSNVSMLMPSPDREAHDSYLQRYAQTGRAAHHRTSPRRSPLSARTDPTFRRCSMWARLYWATADFSPASSRI